MKISETHARFLSFASSRKAALDALTVCESASLLAAFFAESVPVDMSRDCGDMLCVEWGIADWGSGEQFEIVISRQLLEKGPGKDDGPLRQLSLVFAYPPNPQLRKLGDGTIWHEGRDDAVAFAQELAAHAVLKAVEGVAPAERDIVFDIVESD